MSDDMKNTNDIDNDDDNLSLVSFVSSNSDDRHASSTPAERDEVKELEKASAKETRRVVLGRAAVLGALLLTAIAITWTTFVFLNNDQTSIFETAVRTDLVVERRVFQVRLEHPKSCGV